MNAMAFFLPRIDRYVARELVVPFLINIAPVVLLLLLLRLSGSLGEISQTKNPWLVVQSILLDLPDTIAKALPLVAALSTSLAMNRMTRDNEITVFKSTGLPVRRLFFPLVVFGVMVSLLAFVLVDRVTPWAWRRQGQIESRISQTGFTQKPQTLRVGETIVSVQGVKETAPSQYRLDRVLLIEENGTRLVSALTGTYRNGVWALTNAQIQEFDTSGNPTRHWQDPNFRKRLTLDFRTLYNAFSENDLLRLPFTELTQKADGARGLGKFAEARDYDISRWFNIALPWMALPLSLLAAGLAILFSKAGAFTGVLFSVGATFVGWNTFLLLKGIANGGYLSPFIAAWLTHALFLIGGLWILRKTE
jgi:lipopolysaccharide export system permease protein